jgi:sec-independent protein translocase protein TatA
MPSGPEWIIVLVVVLVIFGGSQLPKLARNLGKAQKEFKDGLSEGEQEAAKEAAQQRAAADKAAAIDPAVERTDAPPPA